jgi:ribosomal protein S18 acetylase RimI-like enzyme
MSSLYTFKEFTAVKDMLVNYELIVQLSPHITRQRYEEMLVDMVKHGYRQLCIYDGEKCIGLTGIWIATKLYSGKYIELDNVVIDKDYRSKGIGKMLCDKAIEEGRRAGCETVMLDAYAENQDAHRFYFREGFIIRGFHFLKKLK